MSSVAVWEPASGREANAYRLNRIRDHPNAYCRPGRIQHRKDAEPTLHKRIGIVVSPSPVSTGRLHPSRGFHLRPIKHVFNMRATRISKIHGILILEQASRLDAFSGYPFRT